jgi:hypothetical protein
MLWPMKTPQRQTRVLGFRVDGSDVAGGTATTNGLLEGDQHATITENSSGDYTLTFNTAFARVPVVSGTVATDVSTLRIVSVTAAAVRIEQVGADQTTPLADGDFHLIVMGYDTADET